jgi:hypothetical protein
MNISEATARRIRVLEIRLRLERVAVEAHNRACKPENPASYPNGVESYFPYILGLVENQRLMETFGLIRFARYAYQKSSDILHGRSSLLTASTVVLDEWVAAVEALESLLSSTQSSEQIGSLGAPRTSSDAQPSKMDA